MKKEMGTYYSSLSCERISKSLHNCFGLKTGRSYETEVTTKNNLSNLPLRNDSSSLGSHESIAVAQPKRKASRKSRRSSKEVCCCKGSEADNDGFAYNICSVQVNPRLPTTSSQSPLVMTQSQRHSRDRKLSGDIPAKSRLCDVSNEQIPDLSMEVGELKQTVVQANGSKILVKTVLTDTNQLKGELARNNSDFVCINNLDVKSTTSTSPYNSVIKNDGLSSNAVGCEKTISTRSEETDSSVVTTPAIQGEKSSQKNVVDVDYFRNLVTAETSRLSESIEKWNKILLGGNSHCPTEVCDEIRTVIGQTRLVISERFKQFGKLVDRAGGRVGSTSDQKPVLISDLQGFWDMIYFQVQDVDSKFESLDKLRENKWKSTDSSHLEASKTSVKAQKKPKSAPRKIPAKKKAPSNEEDRKRREAARKRLAEARKALAYRNQVEQDVMSSTDLATPKCSPQNFVTDTSNNRTKEKTVCHVNGDVVDTTASCKRPDSLVDAISCSVTVNQVNADNTSHSSISSTSMVH